jgi:cytoskeletal protein CcmA (bactofilin family)
MSTSTESKQSKVMDKRHAQGRSVKRSTKNPRESVWRRKTDEIVAFFGEGVECKGTITNHGNIRIDGRFEGEIHTKGTLIVGQQGMIEAKVRAGSVETEGTIIGDITAKTNVTLRSTTTGEGELKTPELYMEDGAVLHTPWVLRMKNVKISGRQVDAKGLNIIESHGVDQTHLFTKK